MINLNNAKLIGTGEWIKDSAYQVYELDGKYYSVIVVGSMNKELDEDTITEINQETSNHMAQQTAVNWLLSELQIRLLKIKSEPNGIVRERMINSFLIDAEQAEAMEKEQIIEAATRWKGTDFAEQYYNETYNK